MHLHIEIVSDSVCPWCFIGKRKLEIALTTLRAQQPDASVNLSWLPFELNPQTPPAGTDRETYRSTKFGSLQKSRQLDAEVARAGAEVGIAFDFARMERAPDATNTSH